MRKGTRPALDEVSKKLPHRQEPDDGVRLLTEAQVRAGADLPSTLWRWEAQGEFPKRVKLGDYRVGWAEDEINAWIAARMAARTVEPNTAA